MPTTITTSAKTQSPKQLTLFDIYGDENYDYEKILKESIISCKIR